MVAGFAERNQDRRVLGIDASAKVAETVDAVTRIAKATGELIGVTVTDQDIELNPNYHAGIYGIPNEQTLDAMKVAARTEGMITDPVYEGKSMAGLIELVDRGEIDRGSTVLYAYLGGQPALNGYSALF
jgi:1-aminocyclopropane-1-carboxylate deaminase